MGLSVYREDPILNVTEVFSYSYTCAEESNSVRCIPVPRVYWYHLEMKGFVSLMMGDLLKPEILGPFCGREAFYGRTQPMNQPCGRTLALHWPTQACRTGGLCVAWRESAARGSRRGCCRWGSGPDGCRLLLTYQLQPLCT